MKRIIIQFLMLCLCISTILGQRLAFDEKIYPEGLGRSEYTPVYWDKYNLYYYIHNTSNSLTSSQCQTAIQNAFETWSRYSNFIFTRSYILSLADIELSWELGDHGNCATFYPGTPYIAHASWGKKTDRTPPCYIHFNDAYTFSTDSTSYDIESLALHEIGHVLGLDDNDNHPSSVMYESLPLGISGIRRDLTTNDVAELYNIYEIPYSIDGPKLISSSGTYDINNLPSGFNVSWSLSDSYYNNGYNLLIPNYPTTGHCVIVRDQSHDLTDATLMAAIKINGDTIQTLTKNGIYAYEGFRGHYTSGNISSDINYTMILPVIPNYSTYITSPNLCGATVSYSNTATIPYYWAHNPYTGEIVVIMPNNSNGIPIVFNIDDVCGNQYTLYLFAQNNYIMNISNDSNSITITLDENDDSERGLIIDQLWTVEVLNATTGVQMTSLSSTSRSVSISTSGWPSGIYIVKVTIGKEVYTEKVIVK